MAQKSIHDYLNVINKTTEQRAEEAQEADPPSNIFTQTTTARQSDSSEASATGRLVTSGPEYPDVYV